MVQKIKEEQLVYTTQEVAKILHSSPNYIYELINILEELQWEMI